MKIRTLFSLVILLLILAAGAAILLHYDPFGWDISLVRRSTTRARDSLLREVRAVYRLNTVELVHKTVFPYDFVPADTDWRRIFYNDAVGRLTPEEQKLKKFYEFCRGLGIDLASRDPGFAVVTIIAKAGFDLTGFPLEENFRQSEEALEITLPEPSITEMIIQDPATERYPYPGMEISPENWKKLTEYVVSRMRPVIEKSDLLARARSRGEDLLRHIAAPRGIRQLDFIYTDKNSPSPSG